MCDKILQNVVIQLSNLEIAKRVRVNTAALFLQELSLLFGGLVFKLALTYSVCKFLLRSEGCRART